MLLALLCLVGASCQKTQQGARVDPALGTLVPADTTLLAGIRVEELMKLPVYQRYLADRPIGPLDEFAARTGLTDRKDVWELLLIYNGTEAVVLGRGKIANEAEPRLKSEKSDSKRFGYKGYTLVGDEESAVLLLGPSVAGIGSAPALRRIVDTRDQSNGPPAALAMRMQEVPREAVIWAAMAGASFNPPQGMPANLGNLIKVANSVQSGSFYMDLRLGIAAKASGNTETEESAKELASNLRGLLGFARVGASKTKGGMDKLLDGVRVTQEGTNVNVYLDAPEEALGQLLDVWAGQTQKGRPRLQ